MRSRLSVLVAGFGLCWVTVPLVAHHGAELDYDRQKLVAGMGVISKVEWTNPHMRVYVDVTDEKGLVTTWNLELGSPNSVYRRGWTRDDLKVGDQISFKGFGGRVVLTRAVAEEIIMADGRPFTGATGVPQR